jgi:cobyric acid synthase
LATDKANLSRARQQLAQADVVFLSGGEVEDGMAWLVRHGLVGLLREMQQAGVRFVGVSAGTIMLGSHWVHWDVEGDDDTSSLFDCLGFSPLLFDVHGESEDWVELKAALKLLGDGAVGYGLPSGCTVAADGHGNLTSLDGEPLVFVNDAGQIRMKAE